ncbi:MAG: zinc ribbon domain-containing protein [Acidobacteriia bacterium]|nr:zinc ribbon domain-containing protein [Terriglobia bacterium]
MQCPKCKQDNPPTAQFCTRCHTPLRYTCPACKHVQSHGGQCEQCGVDFAKYSAMLVFSAQNAAARDRDRTRARTSLLKQVLLLPITGGISLVRFLLARLRGD